LVELSVEEAQRLARQFLTGKAGEADIQRLQAGLAEDQTLALELLAQIQTALDDVAPSGLTVDQAKSVDSRIEALVVPRIKKSSAFGWLKKFFKSKPKSEASEEGEAPAKRRKFKTGSAGSPQVHEAAVVAAPPAELPAPSVIEDGDGLEEMAPISSAPVEASAPAPAPEASKAEPAAPPKPVDSEAAKKRKALLLKVLAVLAVMALLGGLVWWWMHHPKAVPAPVAPPVVLTMPAPTPKPTLVNRTPQRGRNLSQPKQEPLPAQLRVTTPQAAGQLEE